MIEKSKFQFVFFMLIILSIFSGCKRDFQPTKIKYVVVIGIDAMSVGGLSKANTPNFDEYVSKGAYSFNTRNILPTVSAPNWEAMLTGSVAAQTGVTSNEWRFNNYSLPPVVTTENGRYPDIFYVIKKSNPLLKTASVYQWEGFANLYDKTNVDLDFHADNEISTAKKAADVILTEKPNFLFIHIDHVDATGHTKGHMSEDYLKAVSLADSLTKIVVDATRKAGILEETMIIITADHGGIGFGHGDETVQGNEVPFILYGGGIKKGYKIPVAVNLFDLAPTVAFALHVTVPQVWVGRPVICAFEGSPDVEESMQIGKFMAPVSSIPVILPQKANGESGGLFIGKQAIVSMKSESKDGKIRYTTDGSIPTLQSQEYVRPFEMKSSGVVKAAFFGNDGSQSSYSEGYFRIANNVTSLTGVSYKLYKGNNWTKIPMFSTMKPIEVGRVFEFSTDELQDKLTRLGDYTGVVFEGRISIDNEGAYTFSTRSDDGSKLFIDNTEIVNNDGDHGIREREGTLNLKPGKHPIRVEFFNAGGGFYLGVTLRGPGIVKQFISPEKLTTK